MFSFLSMMTDYEQRKIASFDNRDETGKGAYVDTCEVYDSDQPYETAVAHHRFNNGYLIIVEMYNTKKEAKAGHDKWVKIMTSKKLPKQLKDVSTAGVAKLLDSLGSKFRVNKIK